MGDNGQYHIVSLEFASAKQPEFSKRRGESYVRFNAQDDYPEYLIYLLDNSPKHNAIVNSKVTYIIGAGMKAETDDVKAQWFIATYGSLIRQIAMDLRAFGMSYVQVIPKRAKSKGAAFAHLSYANMRSDKGNKRFFWKDNWKEQWISAKEMPAYGPLLTKSSVLCFKELRAGKGTYGLPDFLPAINYIEADIEVAKHTLNNAKSGFTASKFINFYNGEPTEQAKRSIEMRFEDRYGGSTGKKFILGFNTDPAKRPTVEDLGVSDLTKEDFSAVDQMIATNIYAGHQITSPALFGVPHPNHSLGGNSGAELQRSYEIFKATYAAEKKAQLERIINYMAQLCGVTVPIQLMDLEPVGIEITENLLLKVAPRSWVLEKLGIDASKYTDAPIEGVASAAPAPGAVTPVQTAQQMVNEHLKNLTGRQQQQLERVIRRYKSGKIDRAAAMLLLSGFGIADEDVNALLGAEQFSADEDVFGTDDDVAMLFAAFGEDSAQFNCFGKEICTAETFAARKIEDVEDKLKVYVEANPKATAETIAKDLNIDVEIVQEYLDGVSGGSAQKPPQKIPKFEIRYSYEKRADVSGPEVLPTTRPFCRKLLALNKLYTRKEIQQISAFLGYDVMLRAGGFWNDNGEVKYHCRHEFYSQIVIRKK
jgi:hypothetical protein